MDRVQPATQDPPSTFRNNPRVLSQELPLCSTNDPPNPNKNSLIIKKVEKGNLCALLIGMQIRFKDYGTKYEGFLKILK